MEVATVLPSSVTAQGKWLVALTEGREWAVISFALLSTIALLCTIGRAVSERQQSSASAQSLAKHAEFVTFQRSYLVVYIVIMLADWLQGTHMYTLYEKYGENNDDVHCGTLFFTGFLAAAFFGTPTGPLVDRYGRKRACLVYVALEVTINLLEHFNHMGLLLIGRVLGGISTSLLFSAFEAWMVTEHRARGFPEEWISKTFSLCAVWNGATAIAAGLLAQISADMQGDIGPFQLAIALTIIAGLLIMPWAENYGQAADGDGKPSAGQGDVASASDVTKMTVPQLRATLKERGLEYTGVKNELCARLAAALDKGQPARQGAVSASDGTGLLAAWASVRADRGLLIVGAAYALFEGAMYTFVFNWVPSLATALGGFEKITPVQGLLFSCLMAAISIGGEVYGFLSKILPVETIGVMIFGLSTVCMGVPVLCDLFGCGIHSNFTVHFMAFLGFEMCVGAFQPCIATHRSKYVPDAKQSTVNNIFRLPLNLIVAAGTVLSNYLPRYQIFLICACSHALATTLQVQLAAASSGAAACPREDPTDAEIAEITRLGYTPLQARRALKSTQCNVQHAVQLLAPAPPAHPTAAPVRPRKSFEKKKRA